jgi:hypothetical protein
VSTERRRSPRYAISDNIPLNGNVCGTLVNFSSAGVYFRTGVLLAVGDEISLVLPFRYATQTETHAICTARVMRVEPLDEGYGVAAAYELVALTAAPTV